MGESGKTGLHTQDSLGLKIMAEVLQKKSRTLKRLALKLEAYGKVQLTCGQVVLALSFSHKAVLAGFHLCGTLRFL